MTTGQFAWLLGKLKYWAQYMPRGRLQLRLVQRWFSSHWNQTRGRWTDVVTPDSKLIQHLQWFQKRKLWEQGIPLHPPAPSQDLFTDASSRSWGAQLGDSSVSGVWCRQWQSKHINILEMRAVFLACSALQDQLKGVVTRLHVDNSTMVAHLKKEGGTRSHELVQLTRKFLLWCDRARIQIHAVHIS